MVSAWARTDLDGRSNEITAIPRLLEMLQVTGCIVTIDAMGCQKEIASKILEEGADYVLAVKRNQGSLEGVRDVFDLARNSGFDGLSHDYHETVDAGHGRVETRRCWAVSDLDSVRYVDEGGQWSGLTTLVMVEGERRVGVRRPWSRATTYRACRASKLLDAVRSHLENKLHWS